MNSENKSVPTFLPIFRIFLSSPFFCPDGNDYLDGGVGNDQLWGGGGNDHLMNGNETEYPPELRKLAGCSSPAYRLAA
jgi:hypothetical protein